METLLDSGEINYQELKKDYEELKKRIEQLEEHTGIPNPHKNYPQPYTFTQSVTSPFFHSATFGFFLPLRLN